MNKNISHLKIKSISALFLVSDINHSIEFYTQQLGFEIQFLYEDFYCGIAKDGHSIHLKSGKPAKEERINRKNNEDADIVISTDNIEVLFSDFQNKPVDTLKALREMPYGKEFYITDPDNYIIAFIEGKNNPVSK